MLCYYLNHDKTFLQKEVDVGPTVQKTLASNTEFYSYLSTIVSVSLEDVIEHPKYIKYELLYLKRGACIFMGVGSLYPIFGKIVNIISWHSSYFVKVQECNTICFNSHFNSFVVSFTSICQFLPIHSLPMYPVLHIRKMCTVNEHQFLTLKQFVYM